MNGAATQVDSREFDSDFFRLPQQVQALVQKKIDSMSLRLAAFPHYRMTGSDKYRLRVGDYRVIYRFASLAERFICWQSVIGGRFIANNVGCSRTALN
ncbi:MAG: type II toxin-antitoxin system RelE family toxin [Limisphaerales bacterium]